MTGGRATLGVAVLVAAGVSGPVSAQASFSASFGARYTTTLVHDSIVAPFDVRAAVAPALTLAAGLPLKAPWTAVATLDVSFANVSRYDRDGSVVPITHLTTLAVGVALRRDLQHGLGVAAGAGLLAYIPSHKIGLFHDGGGAVQPLRQASLDYSPPPLAARGVAVEARYDLHGFLTPALRSEGFVNSTVVHRVSLGLRYRLRGSPR